MTPPDASRDRDLEQIERALAEGRVTAADDRERELQELALALRDDPPDPQPRFARELDERVAAAFPRPGRLRALGARRWMPPAAIAATAVVAFAIAAGAGVFDSGSDTRTASAPQSGGGAPPGRRVERSANVTLSAPGDKLGRVASAVASAAEREGGFVMSSDVTTGAGPSAGGLLELRVPSARLEATLAGISRLADMRSRTESRRDMTASYNSTRDSLGAALAERDALMVRLRHARGADADTLRARLNAVATQAAALGARMHSLRTRTTYSTVTVTLEARRMRRQRGEAVLF